MGAELGKKISELLNSGKMSQKELASKLGITEAVISRYISGSRDPKPEMVANIASVLNTTSDYLLGIEKDASETAPVKQAVYKKTVASDIPELYGTMVFNDKVMRERLPKNVYESLHKTIEAGGDLNLNVANCVAAAMKDWAIEKGATHFTHWFQPMTGITAEKHDSFITPVGNGTVIMEFSGKELIKGESDASSFPSGGLRATFEARGYTAWDPTSYAFVKDGSLYIPTIFCSYSGEILDKKTPLLRSAQDISIQSLRILRLFGDNKTKNVIPTVGPEQEYFIVDRDLCEKRPDLMFCGRTLFGCKPPKGQEMDDHYYGSIKPRIAAFMKELDEELWALGVLSKTKHNEAAPAQHELAPIFQNANIATDHNQLTMEVMQKIADRHGLVCLLHEKPFEGVNGSGKHNNWSLSTPEGENLFDPGDTPHENARFLLFLSAVIKGVDEYQDLIRLSVASAGNDHRLGSNEAPPAIVSIFVGDELQEILDAIDSGKSYGGKKNVKMEIGVHVLPSFPKDTTDRNRTSPFAFTGNKFEFRMLGSSASIADTNMVLNTVVAEELRQFADKLEKANEKGDFNKTLNKIIKDTIKDHKRIIFNGDGYSDEWVSEAKRRGLSNLADTVEAAPALISAKSIKLFTEHKILNEQEIYSRYKILLDTYNKTLNIEAATMVEMVKRDILPCIMSYSAQLCDDIAKKNGILGKNVSVVEKELAEKLNEIENGVYDSMKKLSVCRHALKRIDDSYERATKVSAELIPLMTELRKSVDEAELIVARKEWPYPVYEDLLYRV